MNEGVWEAARCVRPYLEECLGEGIAAEVDEQLAGFLNSGNTGEDTEEQLREVLTTHKATSVFLDRVLRDAPTYRPPDVVEQIDRGGDFQPLAGAMSPVGADKFVCPHGDYVWYRTEVGEDIRQCDTHRCTLKRA